MAWRDDFEFAFTLYQRWRGSVLNRIGVLLVIAGVGELTSIFQNLIAIVFALAKVPVPFADPPPWVGITLIVLGVAALIANRILPDLSVQSNGQVAPNPSDLALLQRFRQHFDEATIRFLREMNFAESFRNSRLDGVYEVAHWTGVRFEFVDGEVERLFAPVKQLSEELALLIAQETAPHRHNAIMQTVMPDDYDGWNLPEYIRLAIAKLNDTASRLSNAVEVFERVAKIRIPTA